MDIIKIEKKELRLNSGIAEENFGKMNYAQIITEEGVLAKGVKTDDGYEFDYDSWAFDDVQAFGENGNRNVFYCGKVPFFSKNASSLLDALDSENTYSAGFAFMQFLTDCAKKQRDINMIGAGGIFIDFDKKENITILILPQSLFNYSIAGLPEKEKAQLSTWWFNPTLQGVQSYRFMRAVIAYKVITGNVPYPATDIVERNADILDEKFLPLEYCVNGINLNFSDRISDELALNAASVTIPGKKQKKSIAEKLRDDVKKEIPKDETGKEKFFSEAYFKSITEFPFDEFKEAAAGTPQASATDEEFEQKKNVFLKKQKSRVKTKRFLRRNITMIAVVSAITLLVAFLVGNSIKTNLGNETSKGLTSEQTVETYFKAVNTLNTVLASNITKGKEISRTVDVISQIYVMSKNRQAYDRDEGFLNPAAFLLYTTGNEKIGKTGLYGVTNLKINGKESNIEIVPYTRNQKPAPVTNENGTDLTNKMQKAVKAEYYIAHTEENEIIIEKHNDIFILTYKKDKWIITDLEQQSETTAIKMESFFSKYFDALEKNGGNQIEAVEELRSEYDWLPRAAEIENEIAAQKAREAEFFASYGL